MQSPPPNAALSTSPRLSSPTSAAASAAAPPPEETHKGKKKKWKKDSKFARSPRVMGVAKELGGRRKGKRKEKEKKKKRKKGRVCQKKKCLVQVKAAKKNGRATLRGGCAYMIVVNLAPPQQLHKCCCQYSPHPNRDCPAAARSQRFQTLHLLHV